MRLLVVDDEPNMVSILSLSLEQSGHEVDWANDGIEAIKMLQNGSYDVAIIDAIMPNMSGSEVCKFIKSQNLSTFIIGISGYPAFLRQLKNEGADICLIKPFSIDQIKKVIKNNLCSAQPGV